MKKENLDLFGFELTEDEKAAEENNVCACCFVYVDQRTNAVNNWSFWYKTLN